MYGEFKKQIERSIYPSPHRDNHMQIRNVPEVQAT